MHNLSQLEKQQVGLRLPKYIVEELDELTKQFSLNRTDIVTEAIKSYIADQKSKLFYESFDTSCQELKTMLDGNLPQTTLRELIDELDTDNNP
ncbi:MAG: ribbon-helix-helix domain-containing protein [Desulfocapsaceae bacterium]|nr:ribbon-helix-helix domain-containing protein [Desulfocapsaceae bacterium]